MRYEWRYGPAAVATVDNLDNVILEINWMCVGYDDATGKDYKQTGAVVTPPIDPAVFVPFDQITQEQVESWVFAVVDKSAVETGLLEESKTKPDVIPFNF